MKDETDKNKNENLQTVLDAVNKVLCHITRLDRAKNEREFDSVLQGLLNAIGDCTQSDRAYAFELSNEEEAFRMTHEWCAEGVAQTFASMQYIHIQELPNWMPEFQRGKAIVSNDWESDKVLFPEEFKVFDGQEIYALIVIPIFSNNKLKGYVGLDNPEQSVSDMTLQLLTSVAGHLGSVKENIDIVNELENALAEANLNNEIISSISKIYWLIYRMDLAADTYEEISAGREVHKLTGNHGKITKEFQNVQESVVSPEYREKMREFLDIFTLSERLRNTETISTEYHAANGSWHLARFIVKKRDESGKVTNVLYLTREINTEKQQEMEYENRLAKIAAEAQRANMAKTDFLRRMSHDIRTPINGIRGILSIAEHYPNDLKKQQECRDKAMEASSFLLNLVNNVLDMNKLESGRILLEYKPFDLFELFQESNVIMEMQSQIKDIPFTVNNYGIEHCHLLGSPVHLKQILQNIVGNAMKYNRPGGTVTVTCTEISCENGKATYQFGCIDTGYGMSEEFQKHAFEPFAQESSDARTKYMGTGLGLSIVKQLIDLMGGSIFLESKQNVGTKFTFFLSFDIDPDYEIREQEKVDNADICLSGVKILLVEDNELNMEIAKFILEQAGLTVETAWNGQEAVETFANSDEDEFDIILMDVMMPVMGGLDATRVIRKMERGDAAKIPIFAMTANAFLEDIQQSKEAGMNEHFSKPLQEKEMLGMIMRYVQRFPK